MRTGSNQKIINLIVLVTGVLTTLFLTPSLSSEPVDQPKMLVSVIGGFALLGLLLGNFKSVISSTNRIFILLATLFAIQMLAVIAFSGAPFNQQFFGTFGRNTGFLTYLSFLAISLAASVAIEEKFLSKYAISLISLGVVSAFYSSLQTLGADPIKWNNPYNSIIGFLGNPNFASSFLGICAIVGVSLFLAPSTKWSIRIPIAIYIFWSLVLIYKSNSQQGLLVFFAGSAVVIYVAISKSNKFGSRPWRFLYVGATSLASSLVIGGILQFGPLTSLLYKTSVRQRGFYWHAAFEMMKRKPILGTGLDSYGDWYFTLRSANAAFHTPQTQSNAAHNVYLDLGSGGGFPLFIINLLVVLLTFWCAIKLIRRMTTFNWPLAGLIGAYTGYAAQALISINQIGLAIWGWILAGLIVGFEFKTRKVINNSESVPVTKRIRTVGRKTNQGNSSIYTGFLGLIIGSILVFPYFSADAAYRSASASRDGNKVLKAVLAYPVDTQRVLQAAQLFANSNMKKQAMDLTDKVISINPLSFNAWSLKYGLLDANSPEKNVAREKLNELNPKIPTN